MSQIALRFTRKPSFTSWMIRLITWSQYSHVEFVIPDSGYLGASTDGVKLRPFDYDTSNEFVLRYIDCTQEEHDKTLAWARSQIKHPPVRYDYSALLGILIHRDWHSTDSWFCAEYVTEALEKGGIYFFRQPTDRITPEMLFELEAVHE